MRNLLNKIVDNYRKRKIFEKAIKNGCDMDGDIVNYKGVNYVIHIRYGLVKRIEESEDEK